MLTIEQAARLTGVANTTLTRAIEAGWLAARRTDGGFRIDPAELQRAYEIRAETPETVTATGAVFNYWLTTRDVVLPAPSR